MQSDEKRIGKRSSPEEMERKISRGEDRVDSLGRISLKYHEKVAKRAAREGISSKVHRLVKRHPGYDYSAWLAESHLDNKMQSRGDKTRVVCSRGRSRTFRAHVSYTRRELHPRSPSPVSFSYTCDSYGRRQKKIACVYSAAEISRHRVHSPEILHA